MNKKQQKWFSLTKGRKNKMKLPKVPNIRLSRNAIKMIAIITTTAINFAASFYSMKKGNSDERKL
ncbi:MAG: hypothetical protein U5K00_00560 [Melioribacteraceae bacterium]|nr:hypothetical protein [Melioribacteraceae bacterium]